MCVDDEPAIRTVVAAHLRRRHHTVAIAGDGLQAWETISSDLNAFDVVITDFDMPRIGGLELAQLLHEAEFAGRVVVFSSSLAPRDRENFRALGVAAIVEKGGPVDELLAAVENTGGDGARSRGATADR